MDPKDVQSINLASILKEPGTKSAEGQIAGRVGPEAGGIPLAEPADWRVTVTHMGGEFWLSGEIHGEAVMECRRCLKPTRVPIHAYFQHLLAYQPGVEGVKLVEEPEEVYYFGEPELDLSGFLYQAFALEMPLTTVCHEDCAGLCPVCGADLNETDCGHVRELKKTTPFVALEGLLKELS